MSLIQEIKQTAEEITFLDGIEVEYSPEEQADLNLTKCLKELK